jgi:non-specific serine/threonine protein kinase
MERFSEREIEILRLITEGLSNREISQRLALSPETVKWYNKQLFSKLGVTSRTRAVAAAAEYGLLKTPEPSAKDQGAVRRSNLPAQLTSYVGRTREIAEVKQLLKTSRLVVLTGAGGTGKTRLALQVAGEFQGHYREGVWLVELATISQPSLVADAISRVFELDIPGGATLVDGLKRFLAPKHVLLLLDNFEHLLGAAPLVGELLAAAPQLTVLATSRERLHVYGEQEYSVQPLQLPDLGPASFVEGLLDNEAVDLFIQRARAAHPLLMLDDDQLSAAARICIRLDGLPLAIELAASQAKIFPPSVLAQRLEGSLQALPSGPRDVPARQRTLRATLEWSHQLLREEEQTLFARLSVFRGGATLEGIDKVCRQGLQASTIQALTSLVEKNLVLTREPRDTELRFAMLETIREYATDRLVARGEVDSTRRRHASYYADLADQAGHEFRGLRNQYWFPRLRSEHQNLQAALDWSLRGTDPSFGLRMAAALLDHWRYSGFAAAEGRRWADLAIDRSENAPAEVRADLFRTVGSLSYVLSDLDRAQEALQQAERLYLSVGDEQGVAWCNTELAVTRLQTPDQIQRGLELARGSLAAFRQREDKPGMAYALNTLGELARLQGDHNAAKRYYEECLNIVKETGERHREAMQYENLGIIAYHEGEFELAENLIKQGLTLFRQLGTGYGLATVLGSLAGPVAALGRPRRAAQLLGAADTHLESIGIDQQPADQPEIRLFLEAVRRALREEEFQSAWLAGRRMTIQEAVSYALSEADDSEYPENGEGGLLPLKPAGEM